MITNLCNKISTKCVDFFLMGRGRVSMIFVTLWSEFRVEFHYTYFCVCGLRTVLQCDDSRWHCPGTQLFGRWWLVRAPPPKKNNKWKSILREKRGKKNESRNLQHHFNLNWRLAVPYQHSTTLGESFLILKTPSQKKKKTKNVVLFVQPTERNRYTSTYHLRGNANLKREKRTEVKANFEVRLTTSDTRWWWFSLYFIIGLFYRSMAPGERTNDCRWRTCFCIIRKKEKKRYGIV